MAFDRSASVVKTAHQVGIVFLFNDGLAVGGLLLNAGDADHLELAFVAVVIALGAQFHLERYGSVLGLRSGRGDTSFAGRSVTVAAVAGRGVTDAEQSVFDAGRSVAVAVDVDVAVAVDVTIGVVVAVDVAVAVAVSVARASRSRARDNHVGHGGQTLGLYVHGFEDLTIITFFGNRIVSEH